MSQDKSQESQEIQTPTQKNIISFAESLINLELQKKTIQEDIKALKMDYKEEGVPVQIVTRVLNQIRKEMNKTEGEKNEEEIIKEWLLQNQKIDDGLGNLAAK